MNDDTVINITTEESHDEPQDKPPQDEPPQDKPHNGKPINMMEISPNGKYLVTYSESNRTIVGWNVEYDMKEKGDDTKKVKEDKVIKGCKHMPNNTFEVSSIFHMCVSDQNILAYINNYHIMSK